MNTIKIAVLREGKVPPDKRVPFTPEQCKEMMDKSFQVVDGLQTVSLNVARLPVGMYFVKVSTEEGIVVEKVMIK